MSPPKMARDSERRERIREALLEARLDGLVCALPANVLMLSGYWPQGATIAATAGGMVSLLVPEDEKELASLAGADKLYTYQPASPDDLRTPAEAMSGPFREMFRALALDRGTVGHDGCGAVFELLDKAFTAGSPVPSAGLFERLRSVKTALELECIRGACRIAAEAFAEGASQLRAGLLETEAAAGFVRPLVARGAEGGISCVSGPGMARARSSARRMESGDLVLTRCNATAEGYQAFIARTYCLGRPTERQAEIYDAVFAARGAALRAIAPRARAADAGRAAREVAARRGFGRDFRDPLGHGVGFTTDHNAPPRLHPKSPDVLQPGMVFTLAPAISIEGWGGVLHCDMVAVTQTGVEVLTPFHDSLEQLMKVS